MEKKYYVIVNLNPVICPVCSTPLIVRDSRKRTVKDADGNKAVYNLRRLFCPKCKQLHIEYPDFIQKGKHYSKTTIEKVLSGEITYFSGDDRTITRWKNQYLE